jgi:quinol monooxygenase YgiN
MNAQITTIIVRFPVKLEKHEEFQFEFRKLLEKLRQEKTFVEARIHQDLDDPSIVVFYETYSESRESFLKRVPNEPWFQAFLERLPSLLKREREVFWNEQISTIP